MTRETLILTEEDKNSGIANVTREGNLKTGFQIEFKIKELIVTLPVKPKDQIGSIFSRFKKRLIEQPLDITQKEFSELCNVLESAIIRHIDWIVGEDIRRKKEGYTTETEETKDYQDGDQENEEDINAKDNDRSNYKLVSISEAKNKGKGRILIEGVIAFADTETSDFMRKARWKCFECRKFTIKKVYHILNIPNNPKTCHHCDSTAGFEHYHEYIPSRLLKVQSEDNTVDNALSMLQVYVLDKDTEGIQISEKVKIYGKIAKIQDKDKKFHTVVFAKFIEYQGKQKLEITEKDRAEVIKYVKSKSPEELERDIVTQFAPMVIGEEFNKLSMFICVIGSQEIIHPDTGEIIERGRMSALAIGPPGLAKTKMMKQAGLLRLNSKFVVGTNTTGLSLTSMIVDEDGKKHLRLGVTTTAVGALTMIDEFDKLSDESKNALLGVMEDGESVVNKYAWLIRLNALTTVFATANPENSYWMHKDFIETKELPFPLQIISRFDAILIFRRPANEQAIRNFVKEKAKQKSNPINVDYNFLRIYIEVAKSITNVTVNPKAADLLNDYFIELMASTKNHEEDISLRTYDVVYRWAKAFARFRLKDIVTIEIAQRTIVHLKEMFRRLNITSSSTIDPLIHILDRIVEYLQRHTHNKSDAVELTEAIKGVCIADEIASDYCGDIFNRKKNSKVDRVCEKVIEVYRTNLGIVGKRPFKVYWKHGDNCKCADCYERERGKSDESGGQNDVSDKANKKYDTSFCDKYAEDERNNVKEKVKRKKISRSPEAKK